jgi:hypothetical protein
MNKNDTKFSMSRHLYSNEQRLYIKENLNHHGKDTNTFDDPCFMDLLIMHTPAQLFLKSENLNHYGKIMALLWKLLH